MHRSQFTMIFRHIKLQSAIMSNISRCFCQLFFKNCQIVKLLTVLISTYLLNVPISAAVTSRYSSCSSLDCEMVQLDLDYLQYLDISIQPSVCLRQILAAVHSTSLLLLNDGFILGDFRENAARGVQYIVHNNCETTSSLSIFY